MRTLVIATNYAPEKTTAAFTTGLCEHLAAEGNHVAVVTAFPYYPEWRVRAEYSGAYYRRELLNGVEVRRVRHYIPRRPSCMVQRLLHDVSFAVTGFLAALFTGPCDVIYCSCQPATLAYAAYALGKLKRAPVVIKLTDLAADVAVSTGIMREGRLAQLARAFERFAYGRAEAVVCLCHGFVDKLAANGMDPKRLHLIPDWGHTVDGPAPLPESFRAENAIGNEFVILHSGNMGKKQRLLNVIEAAELSRGDESLLWVLVGAGEDRESLAEEVRRRALTNVRLLAPQPASSLGQMYAAADVVLLNQRAAVEHAVIPSKLLTYMGAGRAVVAAISDHSQAADVILKAGCGLVVAPEQPRALLEGVEKLRANPSLRLDLGAHGRRYALENFSKAKVLRDYDKLFRELVSPCSEAARS